MKWNSIRIIQPVPFSEPCLCKRVVDCDDKEIPPYDTCFWDGFKWCCLDYAFIYSADTFDWIAISEIDQI